MDAIHKFSNKIVKENSLIVVGVIVVLARVMPRGKTIEVISNKTVKQQVNHAQQIAEYQQNIKRERKMFSFFSTVRGVGIRKRKSGWVMNASGENWRT